MTEYIKRVNKHVPSTEVEVGDILAMPLVSHVDQYGGNHTTTIDIGLVVGEPIVLRPWNANVNIIGIPIRNPWGEEELVEEISYRHVIVRRKEEGEE